mgnify:CR=1 FL=1
MRIISQGRTRSVEFFHVAIIRDDNKILARGAGQDMLLAEYKTSARAKEVFDNIHEFYDPTVIYKMPEE